MALCCAIKIDVSERYIPFKYATFRATRVDYVNVYVNLFIHSFIHSIIHSFISYQHDEKVIEWYRYNTLV